MKKMVKFLGFIAFAAVIGLFIVSCDNGTTGGGGSNQNNTTDVPPGGPTQPGRNMELRGQVWTHDWDTGTYTKFTGNSAINGVILNHDFDDIPVGTGSIINGQLSFTVGTPSLLMPASQFFDSWSPLSVSANPSGAQFNQLAVRPLLKGTGCGEEYITFLYVNQNTTISSPGGSFPCGCGCSGDTTYTYNPFTINLQAGWNVLRIHFADVSTPSAEEWIATTSLGNPVNARWILY